MTIHFKRAVSVLLSVLMLAGILNAAPLTVNAAGPIRAEGTCGDPTPEDINWYAFDDRTMVFLGNGKMQDYNLVDDNTTAQWFNLSDMATVFAAATSTKIVIESGITTIGDYAFYLYPMLEEAAKGYSSIGSIDLSDTVTSIGKYAFYNQIFETVNLPPSVTHIGTQAFADCNKLDYINYFGDPDKLNWDTTDGKYEFTNSTHQMDCYILNTYTADDVARFNAKFENVGLVFHNELSNPYALAEDGISRNIALYYGATNSNVFAGAAPYIIVGTFNGNKKSTTFGSNGFVSCVKIGSEYYILTDVYSGTLKAVNMTSGKATEIKKVNNNEVVSDLKLHLSHEYIGSNIVKVIYRLENPTDQDVTGICLGGSGDIKIGADDRASIKPLYNDNGNANQVGFYMTSENEFDKDSYNNYATLGFIAKDIKNQVTNKTYTEAKYFYGTVSGNVSSTTAAGTRAALLFPERIFDKNTSTDYYSYSDQSFPAGTDSGMSFHWDNITIPKNGSVENAVLYSIYGGNNSDNGKEMIKEITLPHYDITWKNEGENGTVWQKQTVRSDKTDTIAASMYSGATPTKSDDWQNSYTFSGWSDADFDDDGNYIYTAQYTATPRPFFKGHSLTLGGDIGVNFLVDPTTIEGLTVDPSTHALSKQIKLDFKWFNKSSSHVIDADDYDPDTGLYKVPCNVAAAEMMYRITVKVSTVENGRATEVNDDRCKIYNSVGYRVRDYADYIFNHSLDYPESLVNLTKAMLDYGAKAQNVFDRHKDINGASIDLANKDINYTMAEQLIAVDSPGDFNAADNGETTLKDKYSIEFRGATLVFNTTTDIRLYYKVVNQAQYDSTLGSSSNNKLVKNEDFLCYDIRNIAAYELNEQQTVTIGDDTYKISALQVARLIQAVKPDASNSEHQLATSLFWYNHYANEYFDYKGA